MFEKLSAELWVLINSGQWIVVHFVICLAVFLGRDALPDDTGGFETGTFGVIELPVIISVRLLAKVTE